MEAGGGVGNFQLARIFFFRSLLVPEFFFQVNPSARIFFFFRQILLFFNCEILIHYQRGGHHPGIADYIWFIPLLSLVYQRAQSYYRGMKAHIN